MATTDQHEPARTWILRRAALGLILGGAIVQIIMSCYYLGVAHAPRPRELPVGYAATSRDAAQVERAIEQGGRFAARPFASPQAITSAIRSKQIYGGLDMTSAPPRLYVASAAGSSAATALRTAFTTVAQQQVQSQVRQLVAAGRPVPPSTVQQLTTPPGVIDVVPLPAQDISGSSIGLLVQGLSIGAAVASMGIGRIGPRTTPSLSRGVRLVGGLLAYGAISAGAVLVAGHIFGVVPAGVDWRLFWTFLMISVAMTGSVAGTVALIGKAGYNLGTLYFLFGVPISGATVLPAFMPAAARVVGQALPTGAGATLVRDKLYFPAAATTGPLLTLALYAGIGMAVVLVSNAVTGNSRRTSPLDTLPRADLGTDRDDEVATHSA